MKGVSERIESVPTEHQDSLQVKWYTQANSNEGEKQASRRGVVYEVPCRDCNRTYIGETGRSLQERLTEHRYAVQTANMNNGIAAHTWNQQHQVNWDSAKVKMFEQHLWKRKVLEAICIKETRENNNLDCGLNMNQVSSPLLH